MRLLGALKSSIGASVADSVVHLFPLECSPKTHTPAKHPDRPGDLRGHHLTTATSWFGEAQMEAKSRTQDQVFSFI